MLVTHESDIARFARRMIEFRDGGSGMTIRFPIASGIQILKSMPKVED
jgi:hypothetical protein